MGRFAEAQRARHIAAEGLIRKCRGQHILAATLFRQAWVLCPDDDLARHELEIHPVAYGKQCLEYGLVHQARSAFQEATRVNRVPWRRGPVLRGCKRPRGGAPRRKRYGGALRPSTPITPPSERGWPARKGPTTGATSEPWQPTLDHGWPIIREKPDNRRDF